MSEKKANLLLLSCAIIWGGGFVAGKMALSTLNPYEMPFMRFLIATILIGLVFRSHLKKIDKSTMKTAVVIGCLLAICFIIQCVGLKYTTALKQSVLVPSFVVYVPFLSWIVFKKSPGLKAFLSVILSIAGIAIITVTETFTIGLGDSFSIAYAVLFAVVVVYISYAVKENMDTYQLCFFEYATIAVFELVVCLVAGGFSGDLLSYFDFEFTTESVIGLIYLGTFNTVYAFTMQNKAQIYTKPTTAALIMSLESVFGILCSMIYYHEEPTIRFFLGAGLCFLAIVLSTTKK